MQPRLFFFCECTRVNPSPKRALKCPLGFALRRRPGCETSTRFKYRRTWLFKKRGKMMTDFRRKDFPLSLQVCIGGTDVELSKIPGCCVQQPQQLPTKVNTLPSRVHTVKDIAQLSLKKRVYGVLRQAVGKWRPMHRCRHLNQYRSEVETLTRHIFVGC